MLRYEELTSTKDWSVAKEKYFGTLSLHGRVMLEYMAESSRPLVIDMFTAVLISRLREQAI